jgi:rubrerythrin
MIYYLSAWIFSKNPNYLSILKKSELGVYYFCRKVAIECDKNGFNTLALQLRIQAESEYNHAQAFSKLMGGKLTESYKSLERRGNRTIEWSKIDWDSSEEYIATNLSQNAIAKLFFKGKSADSYSLFDKLAFMQVLEEHQYKFYKALSLFVCPEIAKILQSIISDEKTHSSSLLDQLSLVVPKNHIHRYLLKWQYRSFITLLMLPCLIKKL